MKSSGVSSAYIVDSHMKFLGIVGIDAAISAAKEGRYLKDTYVTDVETTSEETRISDILPIAAEAKYPIAVLSDDGSLVGIVSKAAVLSSLM